MKVGLEPAELGGGAAKSPLCGGVVTPSNIIGSWVGSLGSFPKSSGRTVIVTGVFGLGDCVTVAVILSAGLDVGKK